MFVKNITVEILDIEVGPVVRLYTMTIEYFRYNIEKKDDKKTDTWAFATIGELKAFYAGMKACTVGLPELELPETPLKLVNLWQYREEHNDIIPFPLPEINCERCGAVLVKSTQGAVSIYVCPDCYQLF